MSGPQMTWEQKLQALMALGDCSLRMRKPGDWYVSSTTIFVACARARSGIGETGKTPEEAVNFTWQRIAHELPDDTVIGCDRNGERFVRWNGFMWADVPRPT